MTRKTMGAARWVSFGLVGGVIAIVGACSSDDGALNCGAGAQVCGSACAVLARDTDNCGACGTKCGAGEVCSQGACAVSCGGGTTKCGAVCADTKSDATNCGACGTKCAAGEVCSAGKCATTCAVGATQCGSACVNAQTDVANCGACGVLCKGGEQCVAGQCQLSCQVGLTLCKVIVPDGGLTDASVDASKDASTDTSIDAPLSDGASDGAITDASIDAAPPLGSPYCANLQSDNQNCGACGVVCPSSRKCVDGMCALLTKVVFTTSKKFPGNLGGLTGADAKCQAAAVAAGLTGTFKAWLSDATGSPSTRFVQSALPYKLVDGTVIANDWADLTDGTLRAPIKLTELGTPAPTSAGCYSDNVWCNTSANGTNIGPNSCTNWTGVESGTLWGRFSVTDASWTTGGSCGGSGWCGGSGLYPLFCFEQ